MYQNTVVYLALAIVVLVYAMLVQAIVKRAMRPEIRLDPLKAGYWTVWKPTLFGVRYLDLINHRTWHKAPKPNQDCFRFYNRCCGNLGRATDALAAIQKPARLRNQFPAV